MKVMKESKTEQEFVISVPTEVSVLLLCMYCFFYILVFHCFSKTSEFCDNISLTVTFF